MHTWRVGPSIAARGASIDGAGSVRAAAQSTTSSNAKNYPARSSGAETLGGSTQGSRLQPRRAPRQTGVDPQSASEAWTAARPRSTRHMKLHLDQETARPPKGCLACRGCAGHQGRSQSLLPGAHRRTHDCVLRSRACWAATDPWNRAGSAAVVRPYDRQTSRQEGGVAQRRRGDRADELCGLPVASAFRNLA